MIPSKLEALFDDESFAKDAINFDSGLMVNQYNDVINYLTIEYEGFYTVYLNLLEEEPYINLLAEGIALTIDDAKEIALKNINEMIYG